MVYKAKNRMTGAQVYFNRHTGSVFTPPLERLRRFLLRNPDYDAYAQIPGGWRRIVILEVKHDATQD